jgi:hypothetical protein
VCASVRTFVSVPSEFVLIFSCLAFFSASVLEECYLEYFLQMDDESVLSSEQHTAVVLRLAELYLTHLTASSEAGASAVAAATVSGSPPLGDEAEDSDVIVDLSKESGREDLAPDALLAEVSLAAHKASRRVAEPLPVMSDAYLPHAVTWSLSLHTQELLPRRPLWLDAMPPLRPDNGKHDDDEQEQNFSGAPSTTTTTTTSASASASAYSSASTSAPASADRGWSRSLFNSPRGPQTHFYLRKLQALLCHCAQRPAAQPLATHLLERFPERHPGRLSIELLSLPLAGRLSAAVSLLVKSSSPECVLAFSEHFFAEVGQRWLGKACLSGLE